METVNQEATINNEAQKSESAKTFTQAELDKIVQDRVSRERSKYEGYEDMKSKAEKYDEMVEANKSELQKAQEEAAKLKEKIATMEKTASVKALRDKIAQEKGVPADLLHGETEEACNAEADKLISYAQANGYPAVRDAGELNAVHKATTAEQFEQWLNQN